MASGTHTLFSLRALLQWDFVHFPETDLCFVHMCVLQKLANGLTLWEWGGTLVLLRDQREACHCEFLHLVAIGANGRTETECCIQVCKKKKECFLCVRETETDSFTASSKKRRVILIGQLYISTICCTKKAFSKAVLPGLFRAMQQPMVNSKRGRKHVTFWRRFNHQGLVCYLRH